MHRSFPRRALRTLLVAATAALIVATTAAAQRTSARAEPPADATVATPAAEPTERSAAGDETQKQPEILEDVVDQALRVAGLPAAGNTPVHLGIALGLVLLAFLVRRTIVRWVFGLLNRFARHTRSTIDDCLLPPLERSLRTLIVLVGVAAALSVLKMPPAAERVLRWGYVVAFSLVVLVFFLRVAGALMDQVAERARQRQLHMAALLPFIKRVVLAVILVFGVLMIAQALGANVRAFLAGLGIGGLAVALAAQDTLANIFGSLVIAIDQPFRVGEFIQIGPNAGAVEDVGLRSTKLRTAQRNLIVIPNKNVAAEPIVNLTRFLQRRVEQTLHLALDAAPEQMEALVEDVRRIVLAEEEVDRNSVIVQFTDFGTSSLDVWLAYNTIDPDFVKHLKLKQRINLAIMRAVARRGMRLAVPAQRLQLSGSVQTESHAPGKT